jgi:predicted metalloprotease
MRWTRGGTSENIEDRRGVRIGRAGIGIGLGGVLVLGLLSVLTGQNFLALLGPLSEMTSGQMAEEQGPVESTPEENERVEFVSFVLDDAQNTWTRLLPGRYRPAKLVLFRQVVRSGCGVAESAMGPFYCPEDQKAYIDLGFYDDLRRRFGAQGGDFAQAYVLAHELGHHVQNVLGIAPRVRALQQQRPDRQNELSVRMELQADCLAGVWGHSTERRNILEAGDIEDALNAAAAIGDDRIQRRVGGGVQPESFTHGSSEQRMTWFRRGFESGRVEACDTFASG